MSNDALKDGMTIVIPVYNEEEGLSRLGERLREFIESADFECDVLFINDGSTDGSQEKLRRLCSKFEEFNCISLRSNSGLSSALKAGFDRVTRKWTGYMDADMQTNPMDFHLLWMQKEGFDLITGFRAQRQDSAFKRFSSGVANRFRRVFTKDGINDTGCPLKIIKTGFAQQIPMFKGLHRFLPAMILLQGGLVREVEITHYPREFGYSKFNLGNRFIGPIVDCFAYLWMKRRYIRYETMEEDD